MKCANGHLLQPKRPALRQKPSTARGGSGGTRVVNRSILDQAGDDRLWADSLSLGAKVGQNSVTQDRIGHSLDILSRDVITAVKNRPGLSPQDQVLRRPGTSAPGKPVLEYSGASSLLIRVARVNLST